MIGLRTVLFLAAALLLPAQAVMAEDAAHPCAVDVKKFCADIKPGDGRITACIKPQLASLSESCETRVLGVGVNGKACKGDVAKLCEGIKPGGGGIRACLKEKMAQVSDACKDAMAQTAAGKRLLGKPL